MAKLHGRTQSSSRPESTDTAPVIQYADDCQIYNEMLPRDVLNGVERFELGVCGYTRTRGYGLGRVDAPRVRVGSGRCFTGTGIPAFTREKSSQVTHSFVVTVW